MSINDLENKEFFESMGVNISSPAPNNFQVHCEGETIAYFTDSPKGWIIYSDKAVDSISSEEKMKEVLNDRLTSYFFS